MLQTEIRTEQYGQLLAKALPKIIETAEEFDRTVAMMAALDRRDDLTAEEETLRKLLQYLITEYDDRIEHPKVEPREIVQHLMEHRGLRQADLVPVLGTRAQVSDIVTGLRGISKAQAKKFAEYLKVSADLFI